jgi:hypothetical protein
MSLISLLLNLLWIVCGGLWMALGWVIAAVVMAITIVGLPWARAAFSIAAYTLLPFGYKAVPRDEYFGREDVGTRLLHTVPAEPRSSHIVGSERRQPLAGAGAPDAPPAGSGRAPTRQGIGSRTAFNASDLEAMGTGSLLANTAKTVTSPSPRGARLLISERLAPQLCLWCQPRPRQRLVRPAEHYAGVIQRVSAATRFRVLC